MPFKTNTDANTDVVNTNAERMFKYGCIPDVFQFEKNTNITK
jgi:hypothetical protein